MNNRSRTTVEVSVILPCQNEEASIGKSILKVQSVFSKHGINGEIIVSDSSVDMSPVIARNLGAILIKHNLKGYGRAYLEGLKRSSGRYIFFADPDGTYDFKEIPRFTRNLRQGYDFVIGNRFSGKIEKHAMPAHRYAGNMFLSYIFRLLFRTEPYDVHCGMRAIRRDALDRLRLKALGMEFATEMVAKAVKSDLRIKELPIHYYPRVGKSKLKSLPDGWRHMLFMFVFYAQNFNYALNTDG